MNFHHFKKYFYNTSWMLAVHVLKTILGLIVGIYVVRYLGPDRFGLLSYSISFVALFGAFARLGLNNIIVRNIIINPNNRDEILGSAIILRFIGALILLVVVYAYTQFRHSDFLSQLLIIITATSYLAQPFEIIDFYFQSQVLSKKASTARITAMLISSVYTLCLIWYEAGVILFATILVVEEFLRGLFFCIQYNRLELNMKHWEFRINQAKVLLKDSWPLILSGLALMINMRMDQIMIKEMLDARSVGYYATAVKLSEAWYFVPLAIVQSLYPALLNAKKISSNEYTNRLQQLFNYLVWLAIAVAIPVTFIGEWLIVLVYGSEFSQAGIILLIHIWGGVFISLNLANSKWLLTENLQGFAFFRNGIGAFLNIALNYIMIPKWGIYGAAIATLISQSVAAYFSFAVSKKTITIFKMQTLAFVWPIVLLFKLITSKR